MSVYTYPESKVVDEVTFKKSEGGHMRAYLHAVANADPQTIEAIVQDFGARGWQSTPYNMGGKPALQVEGFKSPEQLTRLLEEKHWVQGKAAFVPSKEDKLSLKERIKKRSLAASGAFYLIGDASFSTYGYKGGSNLNTAGGLLYGAGTLSLLGFGRKDQSDLQVRDIAKKMRDHFKVLDPDLPKSCSLEAIADDHKKGLIHKADDLFRRYPSEMMNLFFAAAGVCIAAAAAKSLKPVGKTLEKHEQEIKKAVEEVGARFINKHNTKFPRSPMSIDEAAFKEQLEVKIRKNHKWENILDIGLGGMTALSGLLGTFVKEKAHDPDAPEKHGLDAAWEWMRERPLAIAGMGYMVSTMCHAVSTTIAWNYASNDRRKSVPFRAVFVASNIIAEILLAISSKGHGEGVVSDKSVDNTVVSLAAELIAKQPAKMQEGLIAHVARFLGQPDVLATKDAEVTKLLHAQVEAMRKNPWAVCAPEKDVTVKATLKTDLPAWQAKTLAEKSSGQPQLSV